MGNTISISPATPGDAPALEQLINSAYRGEFAKQGWTTEADLLDGTRTDAELIRGIIANPHSLLLKATGKEGIVGCVELRQDGSKLYLGMLTVRPDIQGRGIGKALMNAAEAEAARRNCAAVFMSVITTRTELIDWYTRHGYHDTGKRTPFAFTDPRFGKPKAELEFAVLEKEIRNSEIRK
jgi:ribosomal protein S18 acetylase RimI-like enzyme